MDFQADQTLDARTLSCPMPLLKTKQCLAKMDSGQNLHVIATDAGSKRDFPAYARISGHQLVKQAEALGAKNTREFHYLFVKV